MSLQRPFSQPWCLAAWSSRAGLLGRGRPPSPSGLFSHPFPHSSSCVTGPGPTCPCNPPACQLSHVGVFCLWGNFVPFRKEWLSLPSWGTLTLTSAPGRCCVQSGPHMAAVHNTSAPSCSPAQTGAVVVTTHTHRPPASPRQSTSRTLSPTPQDRDHDHPHCR